MSRDGLTLLEVICGRGLAVGYYARYSDLVTFISRVERLTISVGTQMNYIYNELGFNVTGGEPREADNWRDGLCNTKEAGLGDTTPVGYECQPKSDPHDSQKVTHLGGFGHNAISKKWPF